MELIFSTGHYSSKVTKSARILCNSTGQVPRLVFIADVRKNMDSLNVFDVKPYLVDLDKNRPEEQKHPWEYDFRLKNNSKEDLQFKLISAPGGFVDIDFPENKEIGPGKTKEFKVRLDRDIAGEIFSKSITIEASDAAHTRLTIPLFKKMRWGPAPRSER